jgi:hypothetical protein
VLEPDRPVRLWLSLLSAPRAYRRGIAFYRLARAIGSDAVPAIVERRIGAGEIAALLSARKYALELVRARAVVQNDGAIEAAVAVSARGGVPRGKQVSLEAGIEPPRWAEQARALRPLAGEDTAVLRGYVEMLVLDYLAAHLARRAVWLDEESHALALVDNMEAFAPRPEGPAIDKLLRDLRGVQRFPRGLLVALARFDREAAAATLNRGSFESWMLPPRTLVELDERRAALITLIEARVAERGEAEVLCL